MKNGNLKLKSQITLRGKHDGVNYKVLPIKEDTFILVKYGDDDIDVSVSLYTKTEIENLLSSIDFANKPKKGDLKRFYHNSTIK